MPIPNLSNLPGASRPGGGGGGGAPALAQIDNVYSMEFDPASASYIDLGEDVLFNSTGSFSFSTWCKLDAYSPTYPPICKLKTDQSTGFVIFLSATSPYQGISIGSNANFIRAKTDGNISGDFIGTWKHVCITFDGVNRTVTSSYKIFVDGSSVALTTTGGFATTANENTLGLGSNPGLTFNGLIDETAIFNVALTDAEILSIYNATAVVEGVNKTADLSQLTTPPVAWYRMGD